ncbi:MAG: hypothetical protein LBJ83_01985 [Oscillospiraceae bacterium]|nr:hypothetical protein [Oscillospiraceae bacterium]
MTDGLSPTAFLANLGNKLAAVNFSDEDFVEALEALIAAVGEGTLSPPADLPLHGLCRDFYDSISGNRGE